MRAVTFQAPREVRIDEVPAPELQSRDEAVVSIDASGICGSDLHIYHGRVKMEPGFTIGHEFVGTVIAAGEDVTRVSPGDRVLGCYHSACGTCFYCLRGAYRKCDRMRVFGHGALLGSLQGTQADQAVVPMANLTLRKVPDALSNDVALFAGDVMGTGYHAIATADVRPGDSVAVLGLGPVGLCAVQVALAAGARPVFAIDTVEARLSVARSFGATAVHLTEQRPRDEIRKATEARGVDTAVDAVGHPDALDTAIKLTRKAGTVVAIGVYAEPCQVHMGVVWIKALTLHTGHANVIGHVDRVLGMLADGTLDPTPLVTNHMPLEDAPEAYAVYDRQEALKIVLTPLTVRRRLRAHDEVTDGLSGHPAALDATRDAGRARGRPPLACDAQQSTGRPSNSVTNFVASPNRGRRRGRPTSIVLAASTAVMVGRPILRPRRSGRT